MRTYFEDTESQLLSPLAVKSVASKGRVYPEPLDPTRTCFQRDRDRIVHAKSFRRLKHKTQVVVATTDHDHIRSRLTHSIEVSQIARHMARLLRLNEDLTEAIALSHDLGHPPFGHAGETILNECMAAYGGFEHNQQSLRIVDVLESKYPMFPGLNLSYEVRKGLEKHRTPDAPYSENDPPFQSLEAQIVNIADAITYTAHDVDDGLRAGILSDATLTAAVPLWREYSMAVNAAYTQLTANQYRNLMHSRLITDQIHHVIQSAQSAIQNCDTLANKTPQEIASMIAFPPDFYQNIQVLRQHLATHYYAHHDIYRANKKGQRMIQSLFQAFMGDMTLMPRAYYANRQHEPQARIVCDYISGMSDSFAVTEYQMLC